MTAPEETTGPRGDAAVADVFWRPGCPFCLALRVRLVLSRVPTRWHDIWRDPEAAAYVRSVNDGNETVPTVRIGANVLTNPSGAAVLALLERA